MRISSLFKAWKFVAAIGMSTLLMGQVSAVDLTGTWVGVQVCPGVGDHGSCDTGSCANGSFIEASVEGNLFIKDFGDGRLKAFAEFFEESYNGVLPSQADCNGQVVFSLMKCDSDACSLTVAQAPDDFSEIVIATLIGEDQFVAQSCVVGNEVTEGAQAGNFVQTCTYVYRRVSNEIPCNIVEEGCCGLFPDGSESSCTSTSSSCSSSSSSSTTTTCTSDSPSSSTTSCSEEVKQNGKKTQVRLPAKKEVAKRIKR